MKRREALQRISIGMGYTISAASLASLMSSCQSEASNSNIDSISWTPTYFTPEEGLEIDNLLELILPATETPGAREVGVAPLVDLILNDVYKEEDQAKFRKGMELFFAETGWSTSASKLQGLLDKYLGQPNEQEQKAIAALLREKTPPTEAAAQEKYYRYSFLKTLRQLAISGYFSSALIATEHLNYSPVPGPYQGCIPASDVGSTWAL